MTDSDDFEARWSCPAVTPKYKPFHLDQKIVNMINNSFEMVLNAWQLRHSQIVFTKPKKDGCPKCGHAGDFVRMALTCPQHGMFGGM